MRRLNLIFLVLAVGLAGCGADTPRAATAPSAEPGPGRSVVALAGDGVTLGGVLYRPDTSEPLPAIVVLHGWQPAGTNGATVVESRAQRFAASGYVALALSMRGWPLSGGADDCGLRQPDDVVAAIAWLRAQPWVAADHVGIVGFSQGGQVALLASARDRRVRAVAAYFPVTDIALWKATTANADIPGYITAVCEPGGTSERSPLVHARDIGASVLLVHGDADRRVPTDQSRLMLGALLDAGHRAQLLLVAGAQHGFTPAEDAFATPVVDQFLAELLR